MGVGRTRNYQQALDAYQKANLLDANNPEYYGLIDSVQDKLNKKKWILSLW